ncbi:hypothetical protein [Amycolatopsis orientalis]|uniref:hypothetical protein n=1 Tax=Amycolatopsis orientalis TaxID=31958 RepID=UPI00039BB0D0|nr:hypothetical protein [Amycolatopsis orientalis]
MVRIVSRSHVAAVLDLREVIEAVEEAHRQLVLGGAAQPARACALVPGSDGLLVPMTAAVDGAGGVKLLAPSCRAIRSPAGLASSRRSSWSTPRADARKLCWTAR